MEPFIITFISGISTLFGIIPTYINSKYKEYIIKFSLLFSSCAMIYVSIFSLIPEAINYIGYSLENDASGYITIAQYVSVNEQLATAFINYLCDSSNTTLSTGIKHSHCSTFYYSWVSNLSKSITIIYIVRLQMLQIQT